jgi:hypothetical protein
MQRRSFSVFLFIKKNAAVIFLRKLYILCIKNSQEDNTMRNITAFIFFSSVLIFCGCGTGAPDSFMRMTKQYWEVVDIKPDIKFDDAWERVVYIITKKFELEMISKEDGYVRSAYGASYFTEDMHNDKYQIRIVVKFTPDKRKLEFKIESRIWDGKIWQNGSDVRVAANMKRDFMNALSEPQKVQTKPATPSNTKQQPPTEQQ